MNRLFIYKMISYLLLPAGVIFGFATLFALFFALANIAMLFSAFITGSCVIYIFSSFLFLKKGIEKQEHMKQSFKDLVKVNAFVALFFSILGLLQGILILLNPEATKLFLDGMVAMRPESPKAPDPAALEKAIKMVDYFMIVLTAMLLFHVIKTLRLIKQYNSLFIKN